MQKKSALKLVLTILLGIEAILIVNMLRPIRSIDPDLAPYFMPIYNTIKNACDEDKYRDARQQIVKFDVLDGAYLGVCQTGLTRTSIIIDKNEWEAADITDRIQLMLHETSHCYLGLDHSDDPNNYMYASYTRINLMTSMVQFIINLNKVCDNGR